MGKNKQMDANVKTALGLNRWTIIRPANRRAAAKKAVKALMSGVREVLIPTSPNYEGIAGYVSATQMNEHRTILKVDGLEHIEPPTGNRAFVLTILIEGTDGIPWKAIEGYIDGLKEGADNAPRMFVQAFLASAFYSTGLVQIGELMALEEIDVHTWLRPVVKVNFETYNREADPLHLYSVLPGERIRVAIGGDPVNFNAMQWVVGPIYDAVAQLFGKTKKVYSQVVVFTRGGDMAADEGIFRRIRDAHTRLRKATARDQQRRGIFPMLAGHDIIAVNLSDPRSEGGQAEIAAFHADYAAMGVHKDNRMTVGGNFVTRSVALTNTSSTKLERGSSAVIAAAASDQDAAELNLFNPDDLGDQGQGERTTE